MQSDFIIAISLFFSTFILEDAATSGGALLASAGNISVEFAYIAILLGIILGDFGLYWLGKVSNKSDKVKSFLQKKRFSKAQSLLEKNIFLSVIIARFIPGARLITYTAMGAYNMNFKAFALTVVFAVGIWTTLLFFLLYNAGNSISAIEGNLRWWALAAIFFGGIVLPKIIGKLFGRKSI